MFVHRQYIAGARWLLAMVTLAALALWAPRGAQAQDDVVKLGDPLAISNAAIYIAIEKGFYKDQGIQNEISTFPSAARSLPALVVLEQKVPIDRVVDLSFLK